MKDVPDTRLLSLKLFTVLVVAAIVAIGAQADEPFSLLSLIVPHDRIHKHPTTEIAIGFGDVEHLSPWRVKRRFPRSVSERGGQLVSFRDAMLAINEFIAKDEEMPAHTFAFGADGALASICDIPVAAADGAEGIVVSLDGAAGKAVTAELLSQPVRDFKQVSFSRNGEEKSEKKT